MTGEGPPPPPEQLPSTEPGKTNPERQSLFRQVTEIIGKIFHIRFGISIERISGEPQKPASGVPSESDVTPAALPPDEVARRQAKADKTRDDKSRAGRLGGLKRQRRLREGEQPADDDASDFTPPPDNSAPPPDSET